MNSRLSIGARALIWEIMNGHHSGAYRARGTAAETEAIAAGAVVACEVDGRLCLWATQEFADLAWGPRPDRCTARPPRSCSRPDGQPLRHWAPGGWWTNTGTSCEVRI